MHSTRLFGAVAAALLSAGAASASTLDDVRERGELRCGFSTEQKGFAEQAHDGHWRGFDVALCRAIAAAVLDDAEAVEFVSGINEHPREMMELGDIDLVLGDSKWTFDNDVGRGLEFAAISYRDGQGFMIRRDSGITSARDLYDLEICVRADSMDERNLADYFGSDLENDPVRVEDSDAARAAYIAEDCEAYTADTTLLAAMRADFFDPSDHVILPEVISKAPRGPVTRDDDPEWTRVVRWTLNALIAAEELGVSSENIDELRGQTDMPEINRLLGTAEDFGERLGLDDAWARRAIAASGNYGEIFARTIGAETEIGLARGLNAQWADGGLLYALPFR